MVSLLAFWLVIAGIKYAQASIGSLIGLMEIVFSILFGVFIFGEPITLSVGAGAVLIIIAAAIPSAQELKLSKEK